jgi:methylphosphotriester-DNA--protein-cysteine methyltransferase
LHQPGLVTTGDEWVGTALLWDLRAPGQRSNVLTIPDLSYDIIWFPGELPTVTARTIAPFGTVLAADQPVVGLRLPPAVTTVRLDVTWRGWRARETESVAGRRRALRAAATTSVIQARRDPRLTTMLALLDHQQVHIPHVADELGTSDRQLRRWSLHATAMTPKQLHRHLRVRRFWETDPSRPVAERSIAAGFYDQSHATNEVRAITGLTPTELARFVMSETSKTTGDGRVRLPPLQQR